nr:MAG TPA: hypothetical protein [Caudoviricetes sp.]DAX34125.1 MAG TPA: hypothetical protein [Caudoviricetes sp.]
MAVTLTKTVKTRATRATKAKQAKEQNNIATLLNVPSTTNLLAPVQGVSLAKPQKQEAKIQNGIKAPMRAGKCMAVWQACEALYKATGKVPTLKEVMACEAMQGANATNTQIEFYRWRKFNGLNVK